MPARAGTISISTSGAGRSVASRVSSIVTAIFVFSPSSRVRTSLTNARRRVSKTSFANAFGAATNKFVVPSLCRSPSGFVSERNARCCGASAATTSITRPQRSVSSISITAISHLFPKKLLSTWLSTGCVLNRRLSLFKGSKPVEESEK